MRVTEAFLPQLSRGDRPLVVAISSDMGSIARIDTPRNYAYRSSKAALNAAMHGLALELQPRGIGVLLLHPGWVRTRMGGPAAGTTPACSSRRLLPTRSPRPMSRTVISGDNAPSTHKWR
jgi:NAD(P)-dependent dehydrogenase (short-subunit alcohol dehydrogenase family)